MDKLTDQLRRHEGERLKPYTCPAGKLTIGVGRNIEERGISKEESALLLANDIQAVREELALKCPAYNLLVAKGEEARAEVLVNMGFNMGVPRLLEFKQTLKHILAGEYVQASEEMLDSRWAEQVGDTPPVTRNNMLYRCGRAWELAEQMRIGQWLNLRDIGW